MHNVPMGIISHQMVWLSGKHYCFVFRRIQVQISALRPDILDLRFFVVFLSPIRQML
jgi:hypothetical protein